MGFLVVQVGHPDSVESHLQWRISFSHQELLLVRQLNSTHLKCFALLKITKKLFIEPSIKEETLTSYHCKTCMFYCVENTPIELWVPENLAGCLYMCLRQLKMWVKISNCPNYFILGENMFDRIRSDTIRMDLLHTLLRILSSYKRHINVLLQTLLNCDSNVIKMMESKHVMNDDLNITTNQLMLNNKAVLMQYRTGSYFRRSMNHSIDSLYPIK